MLLSAYNIAIGVEQRRYPYKAVIQSALAIADEFCIAYDPRFDNPGTFTSIDARVRPIETHIDFAQWDFMNIALTTARKSCKGRWCLYLEMDEVLHEKDTGNLIAAINCAESEGLEGVHVRYISMCQDYIDPKHFNLNGSRQKITINKPYIYHKTSEYMIGHIDSQYWDGKCIGSYDFDDVAYFDERIERWFHESKAHYVEDGYDVPDAIQGNIAAEIEFKSQNYTHVWHYVGYNRSRKEVQTRQIAIWQDRVYGRSSNLDIPRLEELLKETIVMDPKSARSYLEDKLIKEHGWLHVNLNHPVYVRDWLSGMHLDAY